MGQLTFQATLGGSINLVGPNTASTVNFTLPSADGTSGQALRTNGSGTLSFGTLAVAAGGTGVTTSTGSGNTVLSTSPTLVTPILGTPQSVTLTSATGLPLSTGVTGTLPIANGGTNSTATATAGGIGYGTGTAHAYSSAGTSGQVLASGGSGAPTWTSIAGGASNMVVYTSSTTFTIPAGITVLKITVTGAGGGGGGGGYYFGGGGGGGGTSIKYFTGLTPGNTLSVTIGAGGTGSSSGAGNGGGTSSVASGTQSITTIQATGGGGGSLGGNQQAQGIPGVGSGGTLNTQGCVGGAATYWNSGGTTVYGAGSTPRVGSTGLADQAIYGGGGGGAQNGQTGKTGASGMVMIEY